MAAALCLAAGVRAQDGPWTLSQCIDYALDHNVKVKQTELTAAQREIDLNTAEARRLPSLSGSASQNFSFGRGLTADNTYANTNTTSTGFSLGSDVPLFQGFQIKNNIALSKLNLAAATVDLEKARDDIRVAVAQAYVQILYDKEILDVARRQVDIDSLQVDRWRRWPVWAGLPGPRWLPRRRLSRRAVPRPCRPKGNFPWHFWT